MSSYQVSRRTFMKGASGRPRPFGGRRSVSARSRPSPQDLPIEELRTVGLSVTVQERILADFKAKSGVKAVVRQGRDLPGHANRTAVGLDRL